MTTSRSWKSDLGSFDKSQRLILVALSSPRYQWRTKEKVAKVTALPEPEVDSILSNLMSVGLVRPSISKKKQVIFGLTERVGEG